MNGVLALPTINIPPGATVRLSGWDFASAMRISPADAACARAVNNVTQAASCRERKLGIVKSPPSYGPRRIDRNRYTRARTSRPKDYVYATPSSIHVEPGCAGSRVAQYPEATFHIGQFHPLLNRA